MGAAGARLPRRDARRRARAGARDRPRRRGCYPWRTINGEEASAWYAAGTAQYHINADIAYAMHQYNRVTGDLDFLLEPGRRGARRDRAALDGARLLLRAPRRAVLINSVTGPDEYTTVVDNNAYTNLMAQREPRGRDPRDRVAAGADPEAHARARGRHRAARAEVEVWRRAAELMYIPRHEELGIVLQDEHFLDRKPWDFAGTPPEKHPLLLHYHPLEIYRHQVIKQTDVVLATYLAGDQFSAEEKRRTFDYYDPLTTGDSTLSACVQSVIASEVGYADAALEYFTDALVSTCSTRTGTPPTASTSPPAAAPGSRSWPASAACATPTATCASSPGSGRLGPPALPRPGARPGARGRHDARGHTYRLLEGQGLLIHDFGEELRLVGDAEVRRPAPVIAQDLPRAA